MMAESETRPAPLKKPHHPLTAKFNFLLQERDRAADRKPSMATPTVVLLPVWGAGHLMPMLEAGKRLLATGSGRALSLTVLVMRPPTEQQASEVKGVIRREEEAAAGALDVRFLRLPAVEPPTDHTGPVEFISRLVQLHVPHVRAAVSMIDVARELAVPAAHVYFTCNAAALSFFLRLPELVNEETEGAVDIPGLPPVPASSLPTPVMDRTTADCKWYAYHGRRFMDADGIIINTAAELEPGALAAIADGRSTRGVRPPPVYPVGPVISFPPPAAEQPPHDCIRWLDAQPPASVVLLCFGSGGFFAAPQAHEVARGLERSGHRFLWVKVANSRPRFSTMLWVLRGPPATPGSWQPTDGDLAELLPDGFLERTKGRGLVWPARAPQKEILAHAAVGGFVTHCGWNSTLESLWCGVPMAPWPLYAEQHLNAVALVGMGVAVAMEVDRGRGNYVEAAELERAVRELMDGGGEEGRKARERAREMMAACRKAVEDGGSSSATLRSIRREVDECAAALVRQS
ncbi:hypothetical protein ACP70R_014492 [Stipagrostis hirtigluma subsp. patula]